MDLKNVSIKYCLKVLVRIDTSQDTVSFISVNNQALTATTLYLFTTRQCSWIGNEPPYFMSNSVLDWNFINTE